MVIRSAAQWRTRVRLFFAIAVFVLLIGLSRIILGVQYLSDIWAGYLTGGLWLIVGISVHGWLTRAWVEAGPSADGRRSKMAVGLIAVAVAAGIGYASIRKAPVAVRPMDPIVQVDRPFIDMLRSEELSRTATLLGTPEQPLGFAIVAPNEQTLIDRLTRAGWKAADEPTFRNMLRLAGEGLSYTTAPIAPAFWNDHINSLAFERPAAGIEGKALATVHIWHTRFRSGHDPIFVGVARDYIDIRWRLLHIVSPDVDAAAEWFV